MASQCSNCGMMLFDGQFICPNCGSDGLNHPKKNKKSAKPAPVQNKKKNGSSSLGTIVGAIVILMIIGAMLG